MSMEGALECRHKVTLQSESKIAAVQKTPLQKIPLKINDEKDPYEALEKIPSARQLFSSSNIVN